VHHKTRAMMLAASSSGGGGGGFNQDATPPALGGGSGCRLYVARGYGLYTDAGSTLVTAAGQSIYRWKDYSGSNNHLEQATALWRPVAGADAQGDFTYPAHLAVPGAVGSGVTDGELFILVKLDAQPQVGASSGGLCYFGGNDTGVYPSPDTNIYEGSGTSTRYSFTAPAGLTTYHVYSVRTDASGGWEALKNNVSITTRTSNTPDWTSGYVGATRAQSLYLYGEVSAVVFYAGARTAPERASIVAALLAQAP
jgi:hypothetical protein